MIRVNSAPSLEGSRLVTVVPVANDEGLRTRAWIEKNRRLVDTLSKGRLAYVWLPNTGMPGYAAFNRYYYPRFGNADSRNSSDPFGGRGCRTASPRPNPRSID